MWQSPGPTGEDAVARLKEATMLLVEGTTKGGIALWRLPFVLWLFLSLPGLFCFCLAAFT
jgi:hypothetical protein